MKKLLDLLREMEENETTQIDEVKIDMVDEIGKFFVVEKPKSKNDKVEDIMFESTVTYFANQVRGGLDEKTVLGIYKDKMSAKNRASEAIKEFETNLKEMEDAMEDFRSAKKEIEEKRKTAAEKVKSLQ